MVNLKSNSRACSSQIFYKFLMLLFMLACLSSNTNAQVTFSGPEYFISYSGSHSGNSGGISADMDGDGDLDIVFSNRDFDLSTGSLDGLVHIRINDGLGDFTEELRLVLPFTFAPEDFDVGDLNNDGLPDIIATGGGFDGNPGFEVLLNTSNGGVLSFGSSTGYVPAENAGISIADINADGNNDIIVIRQNMPSAEIGVLYGDGSGANWTLDYTIDASNSSIQYTIIDDYDGDGILDIMGIHTNGYNMYFFEGESLPGGEPSGTFLSDVVVGYSGNIPDVLVSVDINEDGAKDIVFAGFAGITTLINSNDGTGSNFTSSTIPISADRLAIDVADIDGDNQVDLVVAEAGLSNINGINLLIGNGDGTFQPRVFHQYPYINFGEIRSTVGDYNGDGLNDMAALDNGLHVFLNSSKSDLELDQAGTNVSNGTTYDFGYVAIGSSSSATTFTISNIGTIDALLSGSPKVQITGPQSSMFTVDESSTGGIISPAGSTSFDITFTPNLPSEGVNTAILSIPSNDPLSPYTIMLVGTTQLTPDNVSVSDSPVCAGQDVTLTQSNGIIGPGEQWVWYSSACGATPEGVGESIVVNPTVTTDYFVRAETLAGDPLTGCVSGQVVVSGDVVTVSAPANLFETMEGEDQVLTVVATGSNPTYQWRKNGVDITDDGRISGTQTDVLTILSLEEDDEAIYTCVVSNYCSSEESSNIQLTVLQLPPNGDCGTVLDFDGNQDRVEFGDVLDHTGSLTLEAWVNFDSFVNFYGNPVIAKPHQVGTETGSVYQLHVRSSGAVEIELGNRANAQYASVSTDKKLQLNRWYHIAATVYKQGSLFPQIKIYIDGVLEESTTRAFTAITSSYPLMVGGYEAGNPSRDRYSNAQIDEPRVWSVARSQADIKSTMTTKLNGDEPNLMGYWDFDEGTNSSIVIDKTSAGNNGTLVSMNPTTDWLMTDGVIDDDNSSISPTACTSYTSPSGNFTWSTSGVYTDTLQTAMGCDSIITVNLTIGKIDQLITFNPLTDMTYGDSDFSLSATSDSGLPITYASSDPNVATISGSTVTITGGGTATITASQIGDGCTNPAPDVPQTLTVNKLTIIATADDTNKFYGDSNPAFTFSYTGLVNGDDDSAIDTPPIGTSAADETSDTGDYPITGSGGLDNSYDFTFADGTLTILKYGLAVVIVDRTQTYGGTGSPEGFTYGFMGFGGFVNGDDESDLDNLPVQITSVTPESPVGSYTISTNYDPNLDNNYDISVIGSATYTVTPADLTATADDHTRLIGEPNPPLTISYVGFVNDEDESVLTSLPIASTSATVSSPKGNYPITVTGGSGDNYNLSLVDGTLNIDTNPPNDACGNILNFDGINEYVELGNVLNPTAITIEAWINTNTLGARQGIVGKPFTSENEPYYQYHTEVRANGRIYFALSLSGSRRTIETTNMIEAGEWYHLAATFDGSVMKVYVDGVEWGTNTVLGNISSYPTSLQIGASSGSEFDGKMDEVRIWDVARTLPEIQGSMNSQLLGNEANLIGYWNFNQGVGSAVLKDLTSNGNDGTLTNMEPSDWTLADGSVGGNSSSTITITECGSYTSPSGNFVWTTTGIYNDIIPNFAGCDSLITVDLTIERLDQEISFSSLPTKTYGDADFTLDATSDSGLPVSFTSTDPSIATIIGSTVSIVGAGEVTILAVQNGDVCYNSASAVPQVLTIEPELITVTADAGQTKIYGETDPTFTHSITSGTLYSGDSFSGDLDRVLGEDVGNYAIGIGTLSAGSGYVITFVSDNFEIRQKPITVTADAGQNKVYGSIDPSFTYAVTVSSLESGDSFTGALGRISGEDAGNYALSIGSLDAGSNYNLTFVSDDFTITPKQITVTPHNWAKVYGDAEPIITFDAVPPLESGDSFSGFLERDPGEDVGNYAINQGTLTAGSNYTITLVPSSFPIFQRNLIVTPSSGQSKLYGDSDPAFNYSVFDLIAGDQITGSIERAPGENVGNYAFNEGSLDAGANYIITVIPDDFTIAPRMITVSADAGQGKIYGDPDPTLTYSITSGSLVSGDAFSGLLERMPNENVGVYTIDQGTLSAGSNYTMSYVSNDFEITRKSLIAAPNNGQSKTYGDPDPPISYTLLGSLVVGDVITGSLDRVTGEEVGTYAIEKGTLDAGQNYLLIVSPEVFDIDPATLRAIADDQTRPYNQANPPLTISYSGFVNGDTPTDIVEAVATTSATAASDVGTYVIASAGGSATNYSIIHEPGLFTITQANQTINFGALGDVSVGGADFSLTGTASSGLSVSYVSSDPSVATVSGSTVSIVGVGTTNITASQIGNINYSAAGDVVQQLVVNSKLPQTITFVPLANVAYGDSFNLIATGGGSSNPVTFVSSDLSVATISGNVVTVLKVGTTNITASQMGDGTYNPAQNVIQALTVDQRMITVTADGAAKIYGDADPQLTYQVTQGNLVSGDLIVGDLMRESGEDIGIYTIQNGSLDAGDNYSLTYIPNDLTIQARPIHIMANEMSKVYGETDPGLTYQITSGELIGADSFSGSLVRALGEGAGTYPIVQGSLVLSANYNLDFTESDFVIEKAIINVSVEDVSRVYNTPNPAFNLSYGGFIGGDVEADLDVLPAASTTADVLSRVGSYTITAEGGIDNNYLFQYTDGTLTITKAMAAIILSDLEQEENGTAKEPTITTDPVGLNTILTWVDGSAPTEAGDYDFTITIDETNYEGEKNGTLTLLRVLGFDEIPILIYPNPADEYLIIESKENLKVEIMDLRGSRLIQSGSNEPIDIQGIPSGTFLIRLTNENGETRTTRFVRKAN